MSDILAPANKQRFLLFRYAALLCCILVHHASDTTFRTCFPARTLGARRQSAGRDDVGMKRLADTDVLPQNTPTSGMSLPDHSGFDSFLLLLAHCTPDLSDLSAKSADWTLGSGIHFDTRTHTHTHRHTSKLPTYTHTHRHTYTSAQRRTITHSSSPCHQQHTSLAFLFSFPTLPDSSPCLLFVCRRCLKKLVTCGVIRSYNFVVA